MKKNVINQEKNRRSLNSKLENITAEKYVLSSESCASDTSKENKEHESKSKF